MKLIECVPNFSEGKDKNIINAITTEIALTNNIELLDVVFGLCVCRVCAWFICLMSCVF